MSKKKKSAKSTEIEKLESEIEDSSYEGKEDRIKDNDELSFVTFKKQTLAVISVITIVFMLAGFWGIYYFSNNSSSNGTNDENNGKQNETVTVEEIQRSVSGNSVNEDKQDAMNVAKSILDEAMVSPTGDSDEERVASLEDGDSSVVSENLKNKMRFKDRFEIDESLQNATYLSLVIPSSYMNETGDLEPISEDIWQEVYLDPEAGIAYVPLSVFYGPGISFSFELVYEEGEWKLAPYSLLSIINFSSALQEGAVSEEGPIRPSVPGE